MNTKAPKYCKKCDGELYIIKKEGNTLYLRCENEEHKTYKEEVLA